MRNGEDKQNFRVNSSPSSTHLSFPHPHLQCLMSRVAFGPFSDGAGGPGDCSAAALSFCCSFFLTPFTCSAINCHMTCRPLGPICLPQRGFLHGIQLYLQVHLYSVVVTVFGRAQQNLWKECN